MNNLNVGKGKRIKVLAYCDSPTVATGFATVSRNILMGLHNSGRYEVTILGINYWGQPHQLPFPIYPTGLNADKDPYGRAWAHEMMLKQEYDILFTLQDSFILDFMSKTVDDIRAKNPKIKWINYFPVDGIPKKPWIEAMSKADYMFTYTEWGKKQCIDVMPTLEGKIKCLPHGVNTKDFFPLPKNDAESFRRMYFGKLSDKFIVTSVNRNQQRKDLPRLMKAFKEFKNQRQNSLLYMHCAVKDHGWELIEVSKALGLKVNEDICFPHEFGPNQGYPVDVVNKIYNTSDCVVSTTLGEGWGLAQVEAMACCKPIISPDNTSCTEIIGEDRGVLIRSGWDRNAFTILPHDNEVLRPLSHVDDLTEALVKLHDDKDLRQRLAINGYKWVTSNLRWDKHITPKWVDVFDKAAKDIEEGSKKEESSSLDIVEI
jgi:glycosyltransferase involved in cell wall biosynthesis